MGYHWHLVVLLANLMVCNSQTYCSGTQYVSATGSGAIVSHSGVGVLYYLSNMRCYWQLTASTGSFISVQITYADFETCCDYVSIYDGSLSSTSLISKVSVSATSSNTFQTYISSSNTVTVYFYTDSFVTAYGFRLNYTVINTLTSSSSCGAISYTDSSNTSGVINSHVSYGSLYYSANMTCLRTLPKRTGYTTRLSVNALSLGSGDCLRLPTSSVDMTSNTTTSLYCGSYALSTALSIDSDEGAQILFFTNGQDESTGFSISFEYAQLLQQSYYLTNESGEISSHSGVGITPYSNNMRYSWQITVPIGRYVAAKLTYIDLQYPNDAVGLYTGSSSPILLAAVTSSSSGSYLLRTVTTYSNVMIVRFKTDISGTGLGFRLQYNTTNTSGLYDYSSQSSSGTNIAAIAGGTAGSAATLVVVGIVIKVVMKKFGCGICARILPI